MKVAIATWFPHDPARPHGGVEAVSVNLVRALAARTGLDVHVITADRSIRSPEISSLTFATPSSDHGCPITDSLPRATVHRLPGPTSSLLAYASGLGRRQMHSHLADLRPDIVHAHDTYGLMVKGLAMPRVFTAHGFIYEDTRYQPGIMAWGRALLWRWHETRAWADQPHIIAISPFVREQLRNRVPGMIHDIENPISEEFFGVQRAEEPGTVFSAAHLSPLKNTLGLVKAFAQLAESHPEACLRLAGGIADHAYANRVRDFIHAAHLTERITLLGRISAAQIRQELERASVFALVSFQENAPMGLAEAMAAGVPVVTSNRCGMPYMVRDGQTGFLVDPESPALIARRLQELLGNASMRSKMGEMARELARERFHPDSVSRKTLQVYRRAVSDFGPLRSASETGI